MTVLVTGAAGFIGSQVARALVARGETVVGLDNLDPYYSPALKRARIEWLEGSLAERFRFVQGDFADDSAFDRLVDGLDFDQIIHLGAQPGVRYSLENPRAYVRANLAGHLNLLETARRRAVCHMVYASSSSVYGDSADLPLAVSQRVDHPISLYAATKKADELMAESYAHLFRIPLTGLRFFTVYGPWGRPDMAVWKFTEAVLKRKPIAVYNNGRMRRDFTYIDDIVVGILAALDRPPADDNTPKPGGSVAPHAIYNLGNHQAEDLGRLINLIEMACGRAAILDYQPAQPGDVFQTYADIAEAQRDLGFTPATGIDVGIPAFVEWYESFNGSVASLG